MAAVIWLIVGVALVVAEVLSGTFVLFMLGLAALASAGVSALGVPLPISAVVFAVVAAGGITLARPALVRRLQRGTEHIKTNSDALVGRSAVVVSRVDAHEGQVKIGGDLWSARSYDETEVFEPGRSVTVMGISGAVALVWGGV
jgi:membrane protein implicated in regulation of membrane protease activity